MIECDHGKLKRIIGATLDLNHETAYATIKGIGDACTTQSQASAFYYGDPPGEMRLVSRVLKCKAFE